MAKVFARPRSLLIAATVFLGGIVLSVAAAVWVRERVRELAHARLETASGNAAAQVEMRFAVYVGVLSRLRALFHAGTVSREDFRRFTEGVARSGYPGFQVLNYAPHVPAPSKEAFEASVRDDPSWPAQLRFAITPAGVRDAYHPITMIEPLPGNEKFLGRDLSAVPAARVALEVARDTGRLTSSGKLIQPHGPGQRVGLAMRMPVYRSGMPTDTFGQRRAAYVGSVGVGFLVGEMLATLPGVEQGLRVRLYEGGPEPIVKQAGDEAVPAADRLLFDSADRRDRQTNAHPAKQGEGDDLRHIRSFTLADRMWLVEVSAPFADRVGALQRVLPWVLLLGGVLASVMLAGMALRRLR